MNTQGKIIGVYRKHREAAEAVKALADTSIKVHDQVTIVGLGALVEDHLEVRTGSKAIASYAVFGTVVGVVVGLVLIFTLGGADKWEHFLFGLSVSMLSGGVLGMIRAFIIGPSGKLHLHKHWEMDEYRVILKDYTEEQLAEAYNLLETNTEAQDHAQKT